MLVVKWRHVQFGIGHGYLSMKGWIVRKNSDDDDNEEEEEKDNDDDDIASKIILI